MDTVFAIGALGGSGTRAVAQILIESGIYMGDDLNGPNDNLIFTRLFKHPSWVDKASEEQIFERLEIFKNYMSTGELDLRSELHLLKASVLNPTINSSLSLLKRLLKNRLNEGQKKTNMGLERTQYTNLFG